MCDIRQRCKVSKIIPGEYGYFSILGWWCQGGRITGILRCSLKKVMARGETVELAALARLSDAMAEQAEWVARFFLLPASTGLRLIFHQHLANGYVLTVRQAQGFHHSGV